VENVGSVDQQSLIFSSLTRPIKTISPRNLLISLGVILDHLSVLGETPFFCILTVVKVRLFSNYQIVSDD
jgi:hypothetical protein